MIQPENITTTAAVLAITEVMSFNVMAESKVNKGIILNNSINKGNATVAIDEGNKASTGSMTVK
ncbi:MAG: hypothetical protein KAH20_13140 [Methylococcales bacterium]|nr:hypothetical protein [Methylococcales bacterium]